MYTHIVPLEMLELMKRTQKAIFSDTVMLYQYPAFKSRINYEKEICHVSYKSKNKPEISLSLIASLEIQSNKINNIAMGNFTFSYSK